MCKPLTPKELFEFLCGFFKEIGDTSGHPIKALLSKSKFVYQLDGGDDDSKICARIAMNVVKNDEEVQVWRDRKLIETLRFAH